MQRGRVFGLVERLPSRDVALLLLPGRRSLVDYPRARVRNPCERGREINVRLRLCNEGRALRPRLDSNESA